MPRTLRSNQLAARRRRANRRAFTLLEIIVVVTIIALLATVVAPKLFSQVGNAKLKIARTNVSSIAQQVSLWMVNNGYDMLPDSFELDVLAEGDDRVMKPEELIDPWDRPFELISPGDVNREFDIVCVGPDGELGTEDDIIQ